MVRFGFLSARWMATVFVAIGAAGAAAFGPELIKSFVPREEGQWWFAALLLLSIIALTVGMWQRRLTEKLDSVGVVVAAIDPTGRSRGLAIFDSARRYAERTFVNSVAPFTEEVPSDRAIAAERVDRLGDRLNELIGLLESLAPSATRINLVLTIRNAAEFRLGMRLGMNHRKEIVVHNGDSRGYFPAVRLTQCAAANLPYLSSSLVEINGGDASRACLLLNLQGRGDATLTRVKEECLRLDIGWIIEIRHNDGNIPRDQKSYEAVIACALSSWREKRPSTLRGNSIVIIDGVAIFALAIGVHLAIDPDGPWTPYEYDEQKGTYSAFAPHIG